MTTLTLADYTPAPAPTDNVIPIHTTRPAKERGINIAIWLAADRYEVESRVTERIVGRAIDAYHAGKSPARVIADANAELSAWTWRQSH